MHSLIDIAGGLVIELLSLFAYPTPELPTPCFEYHTAFDGVTFGIVAGIQQTYHQFHHETVPRIFTSRLMIPAFLERMLVGIPMTLIVKFCSKTREMDSPGSIKHIGPCVVGGRSCPIPLLSPEVVKLLLGLVQRISLF
ncbi:Carbon catabolite repressor protein-like protein [Hibiscus syriacus]|uniref:Carbon catabolite repressor protein-like protein n=1 Tax=Hibiscus syriacus TaxID=106335 RepID=A0A6A3AD50_HIBSY|nr:Carbon catabolite repressor protein-like protein [Hibiscus syriacus]